MNTLKTILRTILPVIVLVLLAQPISAGETQSAGTVTLTDGEQLGRLNRQADILQLSRSRSCGQGLYCSHPETLYRSDDFVALTAGGQFVEAICLGPTRAVGIQLRGDENDGYARVLIDGQVAWTGNTYGYGRGGRPFVKFWKIDGLSHTRHTVRVEAMGWPGRAGGNVHVAIVGIACYRPYSLYLPTTPQATP